MKEVGYILLVFALAISLFGNVYRLYQYNKCARENNVYQCTIIYVPKEVGDEK